VLCRLHVHLHARMQCVHIHSTAVTGAGRHENMKPIGEVASNIPTSFAVVCKLSHTAVTDLVHTCGFLVKWHKRWNVHKVKHMRPHQRTLPRPKTIAGKQWNLSCTALSAFSLISSLPDPIWRV